MMLKKSIWPTLAIMTTLATVGLVIGGCSFLDKQADERLGVDCTPDARLLRAKLFTDVLEKQYGSITVRQLRADVDTMRRALEAGVDLQPSGDAYKFHFVSLVVNQLKIDTMQVIAGNYEHAVSRLKQVPEIAADINLVEAEVGIFCAKAVKQPSSTSDVARDRRTALTTGPDEDPFPIWWMFSLLGG